MKIIICFFCLRAKFDLKIDNIIVVDFRISFQKNLH